MQISIDCRMPLLNCTPAGATSRRAWFLIRAPKVGRRRKNDETSAARSGFRACPIFYCLVQELV